MDLSQTLAGPVRRWQVPAVLPREAELPRGFHPLLLRLPSQAIELELRQADVLVGRHTLVDLCLPYPEISRKHCRIVFRDGCWHIVDVGSLNGIEVNGQHKSEASLHEGDKLRIAGLEFEVHEEAGEGSRLIERRSGDAGPILRQIASALVNQDQEMARKAS